MPAEDGKRLMHAGLTINGGIAHAVGRFPRVQQPSNARRSVAPTARSRPASAIALHFGEPAESMPSKRAVERARALMAPEDTFWDARFAMVSRSVRTRWS